VREPELSEKPKPAPQPTEEQTAAQDTIQAVLRGPDGDIKQEMSQ
jgi:hypothetical protein